MSVGECEQGSGKTLVKKDELVTHHNHGITHIECPGVGAVRESPNCDDEGQDPQVLHHGNYRAIVYSLRDHGDRVHRETARDKDRNGEQVSLECVESKLSKRKGKVCRRGARGNSKEQTTIASKAN